MPRLRRVQLCDPVAERERILTLNRNRHRTKKATETVDEKMKRLEHDKLYQQRKRSRETDDQRKKRLATERTRHKRRKELQNYRLHLSEEDSDENESNSKLFF
ncbi:hypothetical protein CBL_09840 [Carabus blaptoides fortunei]